MMLVATLAVAAALLPTVDPRPRVVELTLAGDPAAALAQVETELAAAPPAARALGLDYLRGDLLERLGRAREAQSAFAQVLATESRLAPWARLRLALAQERMGHPEVAAGLVATLLAAGPPDSVLDRALEILHRTLEQGGDCRLLAGIPRERFTGTRRRLLDLLDLECLGRSNPTHALVPLVHRFLAAGVDDAYAWEATALIADAAEPPADREAALLLGLSSFEHREFEQALRFFTPWLSAGSPGVFDATGRQAEYAAARSEFWRGAYREAAQRFERITLGSHVPSYRADAQHQLGRALELAGDADAALASFQRSFASDPVGEWAAASQLSALRIEYLRGDEVSARQRLQTLSQRTIFAKSAARAALFFAVSDLVRERGRGVEALLALAERTREVSAVEIAYWRGRLAETTGDLARALDQYLFVITEDPFHPFAGAAQGRIVALRPVPYVRSSLRALAERADAKGLFVSSLLAAQAGESSALRRQGLARLANEPDSEVWVAARPLPVAEWPLWRTAATREDDFLLALGQVAEAPSAVARHFAARRPRSGLTGAALLVSALATRSGIALAESTFERLPRQVPLPWVAPEWLATLYPLPWAELIRGQAAARGTEAPLLAAIIREESRFDPRALSPASARGLTQFVLPTARRVGRTLGFARIMPPDLHDPAIAVPLGASYLAELAARFQGEPTAMVAAYNAGEDQTALWQRYCLSAEPEELLSKIGFGETRAYVARVLESRAAYRALGGLR